MKQVLSLFKKVFKDKQVWRDWSFFVLGGIAMSIGTTQHFILFTYVVVIGTIVIDQIFKRLK